MISHVLFYFAAKQKIPQARSFTIILLHAVNGKASRVNCEQHTMYCIIQRKQLNKSFSCHNILTNISIRQIHKSYILQGSKGSLDIFNENKSRNLQNLNSKSVWWSIHKLTQTGTRKDYLNPYVTKITLYCVKRDLFWYRLNEFGVKSKRREVRLCLYGVLCL